MISERSKRRQILLLVFILKNTKGWKNQLLSPQAVMGGLRALSEPVIWYKAAMKRVTKFGKEIYALETNAINHLGAYHLSKHLFNLSFLHDPYLRESKSHERGSIEVVYQLANFHRMDSRQAYDGLFLRPMTIACDSGTRSSHSWQTLQASIEPLIADVEISIPDTASNSPEAGWFYPLLPYPGHRQPFPDRSFLTSNYKQLDASA